MEECHRLLSDKIYLMNPEGDNKRRCALSISKLKAAHYLDFGLEELVLSLWIESERDYDISAVYGIIHWWFKRKEFYIQRHSAPSDRRAVRSHMRILSVTSLKTYERYGYTYLREIVLRRADYNEYKISEADFKNLHPNDFEDLYLLHLQASSTTYLDLTKFIYSTQSTCGSRTLSSNNMWQTCSSALRAIKLSSILHGQVMMHRIYYSKRITPSDQNKMMTLNEVHKFSDGMLRRVLEKLDHMVKDFRLLKFNQGMETRI
ncbi:hypothetical protein Tco_1293983 [Tanacetum coccineum]